MAFILSLFSCCLLNALKSLAVVSSRLITCGGLRFQYGFSLLNWSGADLLRGKIAKCNRCKYASLFGGEIISATIGVMNCISITGVIVCKVGIYIPIPVHNWHPEKATINPLT